MAWGNLNLGNVADALSITGADPELIEQLRREQAYRSLAPQQPPSIPTIPLSQAVRPRAAQSLADYENWVRNHPNVDSNFSGRVRLLKGAPAEPGELGAPAPAPAFDKAAAPEVEHALAPSVSPEAANLALAKTGSAYRVPEDEAPRAVAASALPEGTDRALELLGSQYRPKPPPSVDPAASSQELRVRALENVNAAIADEYALGDVRAEGHDRAATLYREDALAGQMRLEETLRRREEALARKEANTAEAYGALRAMQEQLGNPPDATKGRVLQIVGAVLSMTKRGEGIGKGLNMLGQVMGNDVQNWARGVEANDTIRRAFMDMNASEDQSIESELNQEMKVSTIVAANTLNAIKQVEAEVGSEEAKTVARTLGRKVEDQAIAHQLDVRERLTGAVLRDQLYRMPLDELERRVIAGGASEDEQKVYADRAKASQDVRGGEFKIADAIAEVERKRADAERLRGEAAEGPKLTDGERKTLRLFEGVAPSVDRLREMVAKQRAPHPYASNAPDIVRSAESLEDEAAIDHVSLALLRDESGAALPPEEQAQKRAGWGIDSGDPKVRMNGLKLMLHEFDARRAGLTRGRGGSAAGAPGGGMTYGTGGGLAPPAGGRQGGSQPTVGMVPMVNPETGETLRVAPSKVQRAKELGFVVGRPSDKDERIPRDESPLREPPGRLRDGGVGAAD